MSEAREALEAAFEEHEAEEEAVSLETEETETEASAEPEPVEVEADEAPDEPEEVAEEPVAEEVEVEEAEEVKAPQSWRAASREVWAEVPDTAREEILKRENEIETKMRETADERKSFQRFQQSVEPFKQTIAIEAGGDPVAAAANLMGVATRLRFGTPAEKAEMVSTIIKQYSVDIEAIDNALVDGPTAVLPQQQLPPQAPIADPRVDQMWQQQQAAQTQTTESRRAEVAEFLADPKNEFVNDVQADMADVFELSRRRGVELTLPEAYKRALSMRPDLQQIVSQRVTQPSADSLKRKKRASKQIQGGMSASPVADTGPESLADTIAAAWDAVAATD